MVMGLLRAVSVPSLSVRHSAKIPGHIWSPGMFPAYGGCLCSFRVVCKEEAPLNVFVTGGGKLDRPSSFSCKGGAGRNHHDQAGCRALKPRDAREGGDRFCSEDMLPTARGSSMPSPPCFLAGDLHDGGRTHLLAQFIAEDVWMNSSSLLLHRWRADGSSRSDGATQGYLLPDNPFGESS